MSNSSYWRWILWFLRIQKSMHVDCINWVCQNYRLTTSSDFTIIWVHNKCGLSIYNNFNTFLYKLHDSQKCYFSNTQLVISNKYIYYCYIFHLSFISLRNQLSKALTKLSDLFANGQTISFLYHSFRKYSLRILYNMFLYFDFDLRVWNICLTKINPFGNFI